MNAFGVVNQQRSAHELAVPEDFVLVMLGGGTGSTIAAWTFAGEGKRVTADPLRPNSIFSI